MIRRKMSFGSLNCHVIDYSSRKPSGLVVLCHGYGAPGDDLVSVAEQLTSEKNFEVAIRFVLPEAPLSLSMLQMPQGRAWWHLDVADLQRRAQRAEDADRALRQHVWPNLAPARRQLHGAIAEAMVGAGLGFDKLVLGGFSQGAMLATDLALRLEEPPAGLAVLSGALTQEDAWRKLMAQRRGLKVVQSHGESDPILPFGNAVALRDLLRAHGHDVTFKAFGGGHTIPEEALSALASLIEMQLVA